MFVLIDINWQGDIVEATEPAEQPSEEPNSTADQQEGQAGEEQGQQEGTVESADEATPADYKPADGEGAEPTEEGGQGEPVETSVEGGEAEETEPPNEDEQEAVKATEEAVSNWIYIPTLMIML